MFRTMALASVKKIQKERTVSLANHSITTSHGDLDKLVKVRKNNFKW